MNDEWLEGPVETPASLTAPGKAFFCDYMSYMTFIQEVHEIAKSADQSSRAILDIVSHLRPTAVPKDVIMQKTDGPYTGTLSIYRHLIAEFVWCKGVDNFLTYIAQLLGLVFRTCPDTLKSQRQERLDNILQFKTIDELVDYLAEKRVLSLSYQGMGNLQADLLKELGFDLFPDLERLKRAVLIIEDRNLITHNRNVVNNLYIQRTGADWVKPGVIQKQGLPCTQRCMRFLANAAVDIDSRAVAKFGLPVKHLNEECRTCINKTHRTVPSLGRCDSQKIAAVIAAEQGCSSAEEHEGPGRSGDSSS